MGENGYRCDGCKMGSGIDLNNHERCTECDVDNCANCLMNYKYCKHCKPGFAPNNDRTVCSNCSFEHCIEHSSPILDKDG